MLVLFLTAFFVITLADSNNVMLPPVLVLAHNRPALLSTTLASLRASGAVHITVYHDNPSLTEIRDICTLHGVRYEPNERNTTTLSTQHAIALHMEYALRHAVATADYPILAVMEDDLLAGVNLMSFFAQCAPVLLSDPTVWCASAWNDHGFPSMASDMSVTRRADFFPGLGWAMRTETLRSLLEEWPRDIDTTDGIVWDYWFRRVARGRTCVYPEVSLVRHLGVTSGSSVGLVDPAAYYTTAFHDRLPQEVTFDIAPTKDAYEMMLKERIRDAEVATSLHDSHREGTPALLYTLDPDDMPDVWHALSEYFGMWPNFLSTLPSRASYGGVHEFKWLKRRVIIKEGKGSNPIRASWFDTLLRASSPHRLRMSQSNESCTHACNRHRGMVCDTSHAPIINHCSKLRAATSPGVVKCATSNPYFPPNVNLAMPGVVVSQETVYEQGDLSPESGAFFFVCNASHSDVRRACPCRVVHPSYNTSPMRKCEKGHDEACVRYLAAVHETPQSLGFLAYTLHKNHKFEESIEVLRRAILLAPNAESVATCYTHMAEAYTSLGDLPGAKKAYLEAKQVVGKWSPELRNAYGIALVRSGETSKAIASFRAAYHSSSSHSRHRVQYAINWAQAMGKEKSGDIETLQTLASEHPLETSILFSLAECLSERAKDDLDDAVEGVRVYARVWALDPGYAMAMSHAAKLWSRLGNKTNALYLANRAIAIAHPSERGECLYILADVHFDAKHYPNALRYFRESLRDRPHGMSEAHNKIALSFMAMGGEGMLDSAHRHVLLAIEQDPDPDYVTKFNPYYTLALWHVAKGQWYSAVSTMHAFQHVRNSVGYDVGMRREPPPLLLEEESVRVVVAVPVNHVTIVYLCCGSDGEAEELQRSLFLLVKNYLSRFPFYKVVVYLEMGTADEEFVMGLARGVDKGLCDALVRVIIITFTLPSHIDASNVPNNVLGYSIGYRHMCRFFSGFIFLEDNKGVLRDSDWVLRLDSDSYFYDVVQVDFLDASLLRNKKYIHLGVFRDNAVFTKHLWNVTIRFMIENNLDVRRLEAHASPWATGNTTWDRVCYHTHFTLTRSDVFTHPLAESYLRYLDALGGFYKYRWGDACVHFLLVGMLLDPKDTEKLNVAIPYWHQTLFL